MMTKKKITETKMFNFTRIKAIFIKEFIEIIRDTRSLIIVFIMPIIMVLLYGYAITFDIRNIAIGIVDNDNSFLSREYINEILGSGYFTLYQQGFNDMNDNIDALRIEKIKHIIRIPKDFSTKIKKGKNIEIQFISDGSIANTAIMSLGYLKVITSKFNAGIKIDFIKKRGFYKSEFPNVAAEPRVWYNQELKSSNYIVPGIIAIIMMLIAALLTSLTIVREKEYGTYEEIISTPITMFEFLSGKILPYIIIGLCNVLAVTAFGILWFKVPFKGNVLTLLFFSLLFIFCALSIGVLISSISKRQEIAVILTLFSTMLPSILLSGFVFPIESMPRIIQALTYFVPAKYFLIVLRSIFLKKDVTFLILYKEALFLLAFGILFIFLASRVIRKKEI